MYKEIPERMRLYASTEGKGKYYIKNNDHLCCAERNLLNELYRQASKERIPSYKMGIWINRKYKTIKITRNTINGPGTSFPCKFCRVSLERLDLRVMCVINDESVCIRIKDCEYESKYTTGQMLKSQPVKPCVVQANKCTRRIT